MKGMMKGVLLTVAVLGLAACGDDPKPEVTLTEAEAKSLFVSLAKTPQGDPVSKSPGKEVYNCAGGGSVTVTGTLTVDEKVTVDEKGDTVITQTFRLRQILAPEDCAGMNGLVFSGDPAVNYDTDMTTEGLLGSTTIVGTAKGSLGWRKGEDEGTCDIDMTVAAEAKPNPDTPTIEGAFKGKLCGHEVKIDAAEVLKTQVTA